MKDQAVVKGNLGPGVWEVSESLAKYRIVRSSDCHIVILLTRQERSQEGPGADVN